MTCRLLYLVGQLSLGGLEQQLYYLLQSMDRVRYKPNVVVWNYRKDDPFVQKICALGIISLYSGEPRLKSARCPRSQALCSRLLMSCSAV